MKWKIFHRHFMIKNKNKFRTQNLVNPTKKEAASFRRIPKFTSLRVKPSLGFYINNNLYKNSFCLKNVMLIKCLLWYITGKLIAHFVMYDICPVFKRTRLLCCPLSNIPRNTHLFKYPKLLYSS